MQQPIVLAQITPPDIMKIKQCLNKGESLFPDATQKNLVHADFDPANIMVDNFNHVWKITGILDWEFAFSGSTLLDVANMLRYSHQMPATFEQSFLDGLKKGNAYLPNNWRNSIYLLNITALLDCLMRCDPELSPNRSKDIRELIAYFCNVIRI